MEKLKQMAVVGTVLVLCGMIAACADEEIDRPYKEENIGETVTGGEVDTAPIPSDEPLVMVNYALEQGREAVTGSLMNNHPDIPFVNVQVAFNLYDAQDNLVATVRDTTSEIQPGDAWLFSITVPPDKGVTRAVPIEIQGAPRDMIEGDANPEFPQNDPGYDVPDETEPTDR